MNDVPNFTTGYLSDSHDFDLKTQVWIYKKQREIARRMHFFAGETPSQHPSFKDGSAAALTINTEEPPTTVTYTEEDDEAIEQFIREYIGTAFHSLGSCRMGPSEEMGVVDERLNVHGTTRLRVADVNIAPQNVSGNTNSVAMMIGEKAADIIIEELGVCRP